MNKTLSCQYLHYGLALHSKNIKACCKKFFRNNSEYSGAPILGDYLDNNKKMLPYEQLLATKQKIIEQLNSGIKNRCTGCPKLEKASWPKLDQLKIKHLLLQHRKICNLRCSYCNLSWDPTALDKGYDVYPIIEDLINRGLLDKQPIVHWGSGEPTIFPDFDRIFSFLCEYGGTQTISSNSTVFKDVIYNNMDHISNITTSIDTGNPETYKNIRGKDYFHKVFENLSKYASKKPSAITIQYVLYSPGHEQHELDIFAHLIKKHGLSECNFSITWDVQQRLTHEYFHAAGYLIKKLSRFVRPENLAVSKHFAQQVRRKMLNRKVVVTNKLFVSKLVEAGIRKNRIDAIEKDGVIREMYYYLLSHMP
jgi:MoaA/NifB/PqqE/SkfB family radical SAM enzyme